MKQNYLMRELKNNMVFMETEEQIPKVNNMNTVQDIRSMVALIFGVIRLWRRWEFDFWTTGIQMTGSALFSDTR